MDNRKEPNLLPENMKRPAPPPPPPEPSKTETEDFLNGLEFKCKRCGQCCGLTPFTIADYKLVRRKAEKLHISFVKESINERTVYFVKSIVEKVQKAGSFEKVDAKDLVCPFLEYDADKKASCKIYDERPEVCRLFGDEGWRGMALTCPHQINIGEKKEKHDTPE